jgi:GTP1/Obg family GTP-binding protein
VNDLQKDSLVQEAISAALESVEHGKHRELAATRAWAQKADDERQAALDEAKRLREEVADLRARVRSLEQVASFRRDMIDSISQVSA